jgi:thioredoxin-like negative regulator of GroEL
LPGLGGGAATGKLPVSFPGVGLFNNQHSLPSSAAREAERLANEGKRLIRAGRAAKAVDVLKRAVELKADVAAIQLDLGYALMATGRPQEAAETLALAIRLDGASRPRTITSPKSLTALDRKRWRWPDTRPPSR